jgi:hypothetical protein
MLSAPLVLQAGRTPARHASINAVSLPQSIGLSTRMYARNANAIVTIHGAFQWKIEQRFLAIRLLTIRFFLKSCTG